MAMYTMELRDYIEMWSQTQTGLSTSDIIEAGRTHLFDFDYPIYDENYRKDFETHFIRNFYMTEIGFETEGLFKFYLETWLLINMPYYNKLFESELLTYDPLQNENATNTQDRNLSNSSNTSGSSSATNSQNTSGTKTDDNFDRTLKSDTPDDRLTLTATDGTGVIEYASEIDEHNENNSTTTSGTFNGSSSDSTTVNSSGTETGTVTVTNSGKSGSMTYAEMLQKHRDTFLRIEKQIFDEMRGKLFMLVY